MVQGGDPDSRNAKPDQHLGVGGPDYTLQAEFRPEFIHKKALSQQLVRAIRQIREEIIRIAVLHRSGRKGKSGGTQ